MNLSQITISGNNLQSHIDLTAEEEYLIRNFIWPQLTTQGRNGSIDVSKSQYTLTTNRIIITTQHPDEVQEIDEEETIVVAGLVESYTHHVNYGNDIHEEIHSYLQKYAANRVHWEQMLRMTLTTLGLAEEETEGEA